VGLAPIGHGAGRSVFELLPGLVIKLAILPEDRSLNLDELRRYRRLPAEARSLTVPVVDADPRGRWLIMEYADPMPLAPGVDLRSRLGARAHRFRRLCRHPDFASLDLAIYNWGLHDGQVKLLDLAN
jgi:hypothetical protein